MSAHTKTPWDYKAGAGNCDPSIVADGRVIAELRGDTTSSAVDHEAYANARFIVLACNSHGALLEALEEAQLQIEYLSAKFPATGSGEAVLAKIRAALKKAKP